MIGGRFAEREQEVDMSIEDRIQYLLQAASRAEGEGEARIAEMLRRMAEEARPLELHTTRTVAFSTD